MDVSARDPSRLGTALPDDAPCISAIGYCHSDAKPRKLTQTVGGKQDVTIPTIVRCPPLSQAAA